MNRGMELTHAQARELIQKSLQSRLDAFEKSAVAAHLAGCAECAAYADRTGELDRRMAESLSERWPERRYPAAELERRLAGMRPRLRRDGMIRRASSFARLAGAVVGLVILVVGLAWLVQGTTRQPAAGISGAGVPTLTPTGCVNPQYLVVEGDTISGIAKKHGVDAQSIRDLNRISGDLIYAGQVLKIPGCVTEPAGMPTASIPSTPAVSIYTVQAGDTCESIAALFNLSIQDLADTNHLSPDCSMLVVGQTLRIAQPGAEAQGWISITEAQKLVRDWAFTSNPGMNPDAAFPLQQITTAEIWQRMKAQVFKVTDGTLLNETFLIREAQVTKLGTAFGGVGVNSLAVTDLDRDGSPELVYTCSFGSGIAQAALGAAFEQGGEIVTMEAEGARYPYALGLDKRDDQTLVLKQYADSQVPESTTVGMVRLVGGRLVVAPDLMDLATYTSPRYGFSFQYPADWQPEGGQGDIARYASKTGFFELFTLRPMKENGDLARACEIEANSNPAFYGDRPQIFAPVLDQTRDGCLIHSTASGPDARSTLLFPSNDGQLLLLAMDPDHAQVIGQSLRFNQPMPTRAPVPVDMTERTPDENAKVETRPLGGLELSEFRVVDAGVDTPGHFEFNSRIPQSLLQKRGGWLESALDQGLLEANRQLEPFGYRLEKQGSAFYLFHGSELVKGSLSRYYPVSAYQDGQGGGSFAVLVEDDQGRWLVRPGVFEKWDDMLHRFTLPVLAGPHLITVERDTSDPNGMTDRVLVKQDGQTIFVYTLTPAPVEEAVKSLSAWNGGWVLEVDGTLIVNGAIYNQKDFPADEIFNFRMLGGKPFFFFRRDGKVRAWYDGKELPVEYDEVIHDGCCEPAAFNVVSSPDAVWFYALRDGAWYFVEAGKGK